MDAGINVNAERTREQKRSRRGIILRLVRQGHEDQMSRLDDLELWSLLLRIGVTMGRDQVVTMLQDLRVLGYIEYRSALNEQTGRTELSEIQLSAGGLRLLDAGRSNDDILLR